ncbi:MAG: PDC sensor domain-containing protein [Gammaproteobacteria bacterium]|nr:PDC sensor domain-containing protein [Gammaproteobacteria bacterium]
MSTSLRRSIAAQRAVLHDLLAAELARHASELPPFLGEREKLDARLQEIFVQIDDCKYVYVLDSAAVQLSSTVNRYGPDTEAFQRDRSERPYMLASMHDPSLAFDLSEAYLSRNKKRPSLTAIQAILDADGKRIGFLGVDFDLRELPHTEVLYEEPSKWRQIKGDPAIRSGLFQQQRVTSLMDEKIDHVLSVHEALLIDHGVFHVHLHFSGSRSTVWHIDDPYVYRLLSMDELADTSICLAYPQRPYFERNTVPESAIAPIFQQLKALRFSDETIYLRNASINLVKGAVSLNFSCDGTHYLNYQEFLDRGLDFWIGAETFPTAVCAATPGDLDQQKLEAQIEELAGEGCIAVNKLLYALERGEVPQQLAALSPPEREFVYSELKAVMDIYESNVRGA